MHWKQLMFRRAAKVSKFLANQIFDFVEIRDFLFTRTESGLKVCFKIDLRHGVKHSSIISHKCKWNKVCTYKSLSKHCLSNVFKTLPMSDSNFFFLWFETEMNWIPRYRKKAMVNIYMLLEWMKLQNNFWPPNPPLPFSLTTLPHFSGGTQVGPEIILESFPNLPFTISYKRVPKV